MAANRLLVEIPLGRSTDLSQLCGRRRGAVAGALGAQLRPKRGRSASRGLPRAARRPGAPPRPRRRRPAALRRQRRSTEVNGAAEPRQFASAATTSSCAPHRRHGGFFAMGWSAAVGSEPGHHAPPPARGGVVWFRRHGPDPVHRVVAAVNVGAGSCHCGAARARKATSPTVTPS